MEEQKPGAKRTEEIKVPGVLFTRRCLRDMQAMGLVSRYLVPGVSGRLPNRYVLPSQAPRVISNPPGARTTGEHERLGTRPPTGPLVEAWKVTPMGILINKNLDIAAENGPDAVQEWNQAV